MAELGEGPPPQKSNNSMLPTNRPPLQQHNQHHVQSRFNQPPPNPMVSWKSLNKTTSDGSVKQNIFRNLVLLYRNEAHGWILHCWTFICHSSLVSQLSSTLYCFKLFIWIFSPDISWAQYNKYCFLGIDWCLRHLFGQKWVQCQYQPII